MVRPGRFARDARGATAIEYGLVAGVLALVIVAALPLVRPGLSAALETVSTRMINASATVE